MGYARRGLRAAATARREAAFRAWATRFDVDLRRHGSRLVLDCDGAPTWETPPSLEPIAHRPSAPVKGARPTFTLRIGYYEQPITTTPIVLERNVIASANVMVLRGAHVEPSAQLAGFSMLLKGRYPAGWLIGGNPAVPLKPLGADARPWTPDDGVEHAPPKRLVVPERRGVAAVQAVGARSTGRSL